ncbi:hypothetical protein CCB80_05190 [Armatimonadetes bacterium Uphvl-Ar1]|nr:hypothetical protein CCB80_05190 [Armatimonadetes bacterium Uphvl-Ar1]
MLSDQTTNQKSRAFTLVEMMVVVLIIGMLLAIAVPNLLKARKATRLKTIIANLKQIDDAKSRCALEEGLRSGQTGRCSNNNLVTRQYLQKWPVGPIPGVYNARQIGQTPTFRGRDVDWWQARPNHNLL